LKFAGICFWSIYFVKSVYADFELAFVKSEWVINISDFYFQIKFNM
jgi:hypothetical protein